MFDLYVNKNTAQNSRSKKFFSTSNCQCSLFSKKNPVIRMARRPRQSGKVHICCGVI
jgi:hypothetical protein